MAAIVGQGDSVYRAVMVQTDGGLLRELFTVKPPEVLTFQAWTPDSQEILFTRYVAGQRAVEHPHQLWKVRVAGGAPLDTGVRIPGFTQVFGLALSPDGKRLAYTTGSAQAEMWVMEHFLPSSAVAGAGK